MQTVSCSDNMHAVPLHCIILYYIVAVVFRAFVKLYGDSGLPGEVVVVTDKGKGSRE